ncbi:hypothetical protein WN66_02535 [Saccharomyces cerevisiae]|uniref:Putative uncharacterized protein YGR114C n=2 Tax=Saccharomyces cerevisiae TaxID=4932 RepID=YG2Z_YEAST|nr:RecName: Full=Putative uncharacterized protein YGR114C [Saccharomyces cerevisiae S288C]AAS56597.1 YGR114C [Saccharomyces cerevisiae]KZV11343.1 hypothetical protein WN66_02535 [Saccharomyces cerevisiae]CAA97122.1 unnamed protein product [Saccharomyces cerevisiae]CAY79872.1 EC1118_1G1_4280p [Saccharomyces cerevisiae EC1118]
MFSSFFGNTCSWVFIFIIIVDNEAFLHFSCLIFVFINIFVFLRGVKDIFSFFFLTRRFSFIVVIYYFFLVPRDQLRISRLFHKRQILCKDSRQLMTCSLGLFFKAQINIFLPPFALTVVQFLVNLVCHT